MLHLVQHNLEMLKVTWSATKNCHLLHLWTCWFLPPWHTSESAKNIHKISSQESYFVNNGAIKSLLCTSIKQNQTQFCVLKHRLSAILDVISHGPAHIQRKNIQVWTKRFPLLLLTWKTHLCNVMAAARVPLGKPFGWNPLGRWLGAEQTECVAKQSVLSSFFINKICLMSFILSSHGAVNVINTEWKLCLQLFLSPNKHY